MKNKSLVAAIIIIASIILLSAMQLCHALNNISVAILGFTGTSEPASSTILLYILSATLLLCGFIMILSELFSKKGSGPID